MADGRHLENRYDVKYPRRDVPTWTKFGSRMQNDTPITAKWSRSKPGEEFQYGGRLSFKTGSSYISTANWDISTKFGLLINFDILKAATATHTKPEVVFSGHGRHLEEWTEYETIFPQWVLRIGRNSVAWCRITCRLRRTGRDWNQK